MSRKNDFWTKSCFKVDDNKSFMFGKFHDDY